MAYNIKSLRNPDSTDFTSTADFDCEEVVFAPVQYKTEYKIVIPYDPLDYACHSVVFSLSIWGVDTVVNVPWFDCRDNSLRHATMLEF